MNVMGYIRKSNEGVQALIFDNDQHSDEKHYTLLDQGWELILDNVYPSIEEAYRILEAGVVDEGFQEVYAHKDDCRLCGYFAPVRKVIARYWSEVHKRDILFNGRACEQCIEGMDTVKFRGQMKTPYEIEQILIKEFQKKNLH